MYLFSVLSVANMHWQVCERLFHKFWNPLKDPQLASLGNLTEREQCLVMKHTSSRCTRVTGVCEFIIIESLSSKSHLALTPSTQLGPFFAPRLNSEHLVGRAHCRNS